MNKKTKKALCGSIQKWIDIIENGLEDKGVSNCPLCKLFYLNDCDGCPVNNITTIGCVSTPCSEWYIYLGLSYKNKIVVDEKSKQLAIAELEFLISLYPED